MRWLAHARALLADVVGHSLHTRSVGVLLVLVLGVVAVAAALVVQVAAPVALYPFL